MRGQSTARSFTPVPCADPGCGLIARPDGIYCGQCGPPDELTPQDDSDLDIHVLTLKERLAEKGPLLRRIARYGTHPCHLCERQALPGRLYCSPGCRREAWRGKAVQVELDGVTAPLLAHARTRGLNPSTVYRRLQLGLTPIEALTKPVDASMRRGAV